MTPTNYRSPITDHRLPITGSTQLLGIIGWPVAHSFSPAMQNTVLADLGLNYVYVPLPVHPDNVTMAIPTLPVLGFRGVNVTVPHKQAVLPLLDELEDGARAIGAVNTIVIDRHPLSLNRNPITNDRLPVTGYNTDWSGFLADLAELGMDVNGRDCLILGAGGSARAVVYALARSGGRVQLLARRVSQAAEVMAALRPFVGEEVVARPLADLPTIVSHLNAPLIVNTTPLGMTPHPENSPWPDGCLFPVNSFVYDLVYNPRQTKLMRQAKAAGCTAVNGLGMLVQQGALAFELWTGHKPNVTLMRAVIE